MKICPECSFSNEDTSPICIWCNARLFDVPSIPNSDSESPEYIYKGSLKQRHAKFQRETISAALIYASAITLLAVIPGMIFVPHILFSFFISALLVTWTIDLRLVGQMTSSFLQGVFTLLFMLYFGGIHPFSFFMLVGHVVLPTIYWHWTNLIISANR